MENGQRKMIGVETLPPPPPPPNTHLKYQIALRIVAAAAALTAASIALTNNQTVVVFALEFQARYSYTSAFKFLVAANFITVASSVLSLFIAFIFCRPPSHNFNYFYLFLHDLVITTLLMAGCAAASAEGYLGKYGNSHSGWLAVCDQVSKFCNRMTISLTLSYLAFALYLSLTIISAHKSTQIHV